MNRDQRQQAAHDTLAALKQGRYPGPDGPVEFAAAQQAAEAGSCLCRPADVPGLLAELAATPTGPPATVGVRQATTLEAAEVLCADYQRVAVLNFASARHPGGGFLSGSQAQEESLARSSGLYPCLTQFTEMYAFNSQPSSTALYSDYLSYAPQVPVLRRDDGTWRPQPLLLDFITAPAVNAGALTRNSPDLLPQLVPTMQQRLRLVLAVAARHGAEALVLGAWGCGVFANDPALVARLFAEALAEPGLRGCFRHVAFAIFDPKPPQATLQAFETELAVL